MLWVSNSGQLLCLSLGICLMNMVQFIQFRCSVIYDSLWPHELQHARPPCASPTFGVYSNSSPLSQWCHPTISSSVVPSSLQSFPASGSFRTSEFFTSGGQNIGVSASASVLPMNTHEWFPLGWLVGSPCCPRDSQESSPASQFNSINSSVLSLLYGPALRSVRDYWKNHSFDYTHLLSAKRWFCLLIHCLGFS